MPSVSLSLTVGATCPFASPLTLSVLQSILAGPLVLWSELLEVELLDDELDDELEEGVEEPLGVAEVLLPGFALFELVAPSAEELL